MLKLKVVVVYFLEYFIVVDEFWNYVMVLCNQEKEVDDLWLIFDRYVVECKFFIMKIKVIIN